MRQIMFIPYAYIMDKWRWEVYSGDISRDEYNAKWWEMREKYQGLKAPIERKATGFDIGQKIHIAHSVPYIR